MCASPAGVVFVGVWCVTQISNVSHPVCVAGLGRHRAELGVVGWGFSV